MIGVKKDKCSFFFYITIMLSLFFELLSYLMSLGLNENLSFLFLFIIRVIFVILSWLLLIFYGFKCLWLRNIFQNAYIKIIILQELWLFIRTCDMHNLDAWDCFPNIYWLWTKCLNSSYASKLVFFLTNSIIIILILI